MLLKKTFAPLVAILIIAFALVSPSSLVAAQASPSAGSGQALEIGPPVVSISGDPGQTLQTTISLRDVSPSDLYVTNQVNDFEANGEDGTPKVILDGTTSPFSIKTWLRTIAPLTLKARQIKSVKVTIDIPKDASPGGYYGIIRFTGTPPDLSGTGVSLNASLGSLIFVKVNGDAKEALSIEDFSTSAGGKTSSIHQSLPLTVSERIKNTGNTFEQPTGLVTVKDMFNKTIATLPVNADQRLILSASTRKFDQTLDSSVVGNKLLFGKYTASFEMDYGTSATKLTKTITFWIIPYTLIAIIIAALIIAFFVFRYLIGRYNRIIVGRATGTPVKKAVKRRRK